MYGLHVHKAVIDAGDKESGITVHYVNENYDEGQIICQVKCEVINGEKPEELAERIHALEYDTLPLVIRELAVQKNTD
jgi:phosphoribosylglycinamide formyltransferase-1